MTNIQEKKEIRYKAYEQNQTIALPVLLKDLVSYNVLVQLIDRLVDEIDLTELSVYYSGLGCPPYHPQMMIKVWLYGYCNQVYTSRPLARKLREDLGFIYLSGNQRPCFKTLSDFRSRRMVEMIDAVFSQVLLYLVQEGYVDLDDLYLDGSRWEANANKYKVVWRKNTDRYEKQVLERIGRLLEQARALQAAEDALYGSADLAIHENSATIEIKLSSAELTTQIERLNEVVSQTTDKKRQRKLKSVANKLDKEQQKLVKYEEQREQLGERNSYSKTDVDATFMRSKDDRLLPQYNPQITTNNQFIIGATLHQTPVDSITLPEHFAQVIERVEPLVDSDWQPDLTADAGYGSEENYELLEQLDVRAFVKYSLWYQEITGALAKKTYRRENWTYDATQDRFVCPQGRQLPFVEEFTKINRNGYQRQVRKYECESCANCPVFRECRGERAKADTNRTVQLSRKLERHKSIAKERLASDEGKEKRSQRSVDVETPFGDMKYNMKHRRFVLRGLQKTETEFNLLCLGHNLRKIKCEITGEWKAYYAQRAAKRKKKRKKRA